MSPEKIQPKISINACATMIASLDSRAYQRSLIQDANNIAERMLLPVSLPWTHKVAPVARNIPCDIDEMIDVLTMDDGLYTPFENGNFGFGQFDTGQFRNGESAIRLANSSSMLRSAARRSCDPGVIELSTIVLPPQLPGDLETARRYDPDSQDYDDSDRSIKGELELRCFETMQAVKKRKVEQARSSVKNFEISVKVNSSSTRSSIFHAFDERRVDKESILAQGFLEAVLPQEVEVGRKISTSKAKKISEMLGSYDIRNGLGPTNQSGKNSNRMNVGRTRLMWTEKSPSDQPQRVFFTSLITGQRLEGGSQKRPREVLVRIKVDGQHFVGRKVSKNKETDESDTVTKESFPSFQATLDCDKLVQNLFESKTKNMQAVDNILPPKIECIPDSCGTIHVLCVSEGRINRSSVTPLLNRMAENNIRNCTVCWRSTELDQEVQSCSECGVLAHPSCCLDPGQMNDAVVIDGILTKQWTCAMCCQSCGDSSRHESAAKKSRRKSKLPSRYDDSELAEPIPSQRTDDLQYYHEIPCSICQLRGGPMSPVRQNDKTSWIHEVCRIWTSGGNEIINESSMGKRQQCALCGGNNGNVTAGMKRGRNMMGSSDNVSIGCVVKCAAVGCQVHVHPMCAVVSSLTSELHTAASLRNNPMSQQEENESDIDRARKEDIDLCSQYTLTFASVNGVTNSYGKDPGIQRKAMLPILFCGIHNPKRDDSFYGLYPGGEHLDGGALVIPRCLECETVPES